MQDVVYATRRRQKKDKAIKYNQGVKQATHTINSLIILYQKNVGKLQPRWRDPFHISGYKGAHGSSYTLIQLSGKRIRDTFHNDHLKQFQLRTRYLANPSDPPLLQQQNIRKRRHVRLRLNPPKPPPILQQI